MQVHSPGAQRAVPPRLDGRERIVASLSEFGSLSRADLARRTALAPSTVSTAVTELMHAGMIVELDGPAVPASGPRGGRPAILLALHRRAGVAVGIDFDKRHVRVAVTDLAHNLLAEQVQEVPPDRPADADIGVAADLVSASLDEADARRSEVAGVGMGIPGPVHRRTGQLGDSTILPGWVGVPAAEAMSATLGLPVLVENDANLGALGEWLWGAGRGCAEVAYVKVATGIGAGLIVNGRPYGGAGGTAGEIGHTVVDPNGPICRCGNRGCLEMVAGVDAILAALRPAHGRARTIRRVINDALDGDAGCLRALSDAGLAIGGALATLCNLVNPERVVVGGDVIAAGSLILEPMRESLARSAIRSAAEDVEIVASDLGERAEVLGAVALALLHATPLTPGLSGTSAAG